MNFFKYTFNGVTFTFNSNVSKKNHTQVIAPQMKFTLISRGNHVTFLI